MILMGLKQTEPVHAENQGAEEARRAAQYNQAKNALAPLIQSLPAVQAYNSTHDIPLKSLQDVLAHARKDSAFKKLVESQLPELGTEKGTDFLSLWNFVLEYERTHRVSELADKVLSDTKKTNRLAGESVQGIHSNQQYADTEAAKVREKLRSWGKIERA
jgi:proteasome lid subunit RPN8/RPN11